MLLPVCALAFLVAVSHELARSATSKGLDVVETSIATTAEIMNLAAVL